MLITFLNKPELIFSHSLIFLSISDMNDYSYCKSFVCTQLNGFTHHNWTLMFLFTRNHLFVNSHNEITRFGCLNPLHRCNICILEAQPIYQHKWLRLHILEFNFKFYTFFNLLLSLRIMLYMGKAIRCDIFS